ncbi:MAG TPA: hypothetical protein PLS24_09125 [Sedimentisphaerales bacterium]|nr:hypothetical protein [Sedimentisphaerales bacterium]HOV78181.1 hypothetical protein [Sedimentisphaerales bacterium]
MGNRTDEASGEYRFCDPSSERPVGAGPTRLPKPAGPERLPFEALPPESEQTWTPLHIQFLEDRT